MTQVTRDHMWDALALVQQAADEHGFGAEWKTMLHERTAQAARHAATAAHMNQTDGAGHIVGVAVHATDAAYAVTDSVTDETFIQKAFDAAEDMAREAGGSVWSALLRYLHDLRDTPKRIQAIRDTADPPASPLHQRVEMTLPDGTKVERELLASRQDAFPELLTVEMQEGGTIGDAVACPVAQAVNRHFDDKYLAVVVHDGYLNVYHKANVLWVRDQVSIEGREAVATYSCLITPLVSIDPKKGVPRLALRRCGFTITV